MERAKISSLTTDNMWHFPAKNFAAILQQTIPEKRVSDS
jgi:hypothetical protein